MLTNRDGRNFLKLTAGSDLDLCTGSSRVRTARLNLLHNVHTFNHTSENDMSAVQVRSRNLDLSSIESMTYSGNEELGTVGVGTSVSHRQETGSVVAHSEVLIGKLVTVDRLTSITVEILQVIYQSKLPSTVISPPWSMKLGMTLWKMEFL